MPTTDPTPVFHHVGVYAYRPAALAAYPSWPIGPLETLEGLEQLRFLEQGRPVLCVEVEAHGRQFWELNNPSDVAVIEAMLAGYGKPPVALMRLRQTFPDANAGIGWQFSANAVSAAQIRSDCAGK